MSNNKEKNVFELVLEYLEKKFENDPEKARLAKAIFKEYLVSGRKGLERIIRSEITKILEEEGKNAIKA